MDPVRTGVIGVAMISLAAPAFGQSLPNDVQGSWDASPGECRATGTSMMQIDITADTIDTFGGDAIVREVVLALSPSSPPISCNSRVRRRSASANVPTTA